MKLPIYETLFSAKQLGLSDFYSSELIGLEFPAQKSSSQLKESLLESQGIPCPYFLFIKLPFIHVLVEHLLYALHEHFALVLSLAVFRIPASFFPHLGTPLRTAPPSIYPGLHGLSLLIHPSNPILCSHSPLLEDQ